MSIYIITLLIQDPADLYHNFDDPYDHPVNPPRNTVNPYQYPADPP